MLTRISSATGEERLGVVRTIKPAGVLMDKGLVVAVTRDLPTIFGIWRQDILVGKLRDTLLNFPDVNYNCLTKLNKEKKKEQPAHSNNI